MMEDSKIFISYSRNDSIEFAKRLCQDLKSKGYKLWFDLDELNPGEFWDSAIEEALESSEHFLLILSPRSVSSNYVLDELNYALEEKKTIIPVLHKPCKIPFRIRRRQYCDFSKNYNHGLANLFKIGKSSGLIYKDRSIHIDQFLSNNEEKEHEVEEGKGNLTKENLDKDIKKNGHEIFSISGYTEIANNEKNLIKRKAIYIKALKTYPHSSKLWHEFTYFLHYVKKDFEDLDKYYRQSLEANPNVAINYGNYAIYLKSVKKDYVKAEEYYLKALSINPDSSSCNGNYAIFLKDVKQEYAKAEKFYERALLIDPLHANNIVNYADFLKEIRRDYVRAEEFYKKALRLDSQNPNSNSQYAVFLKEVKKDYINAEEYFLKALSADSSRISVICNYAIFLMHIKKDYEKAKKYFIKGLNQNPDNANLNGNYAQLLLIVKKHKQALDYLERAIDESNISESGLLLELWFYKYAHFPNNLEESELMITKLLKKGVRSPGWDLSENIKIALESNHPNPDNLIMLAKKITSN